MRERDEGEVLAPFEDMRAATKSAWDDAARSVRHRQADDAGRRAPRPGRAAGREDFHMAWRTTPERHGLALRLPVDPELQLPARPCEGQIVGWTPGEHGSGGPYGSRGGVDPEEVLPG